jgi:tRNA A37 N6-isopentenylltransferase MiaA
VVDGQDTLDNALAGMRRDTRHFARRQRTWFRGVPDAVWITPDDPRAIESRVQAFLEGEEGAARYCALDM